MKLLNLLAEALSAEKEKALRDNDTLMQEDIKNMVSEKESLREEVSKLKQLNTTFISRVKKNNNENPH